jgi:hypothetical protein
MQLIASRKTIFSKHLSPLQRMSYGSNSLYYFYTIALLFTPFQLLGLSLSNGHFTWLNSALFMPMLVTTYVITPYLLRRKSEPTAVGIVVLSNAYTFLQALYLLAIRRPLGWQATGDKTVSRLKHFDRFKLMVAIFFTTVYVLTMFVVIINDKFNLNPSIFVVALFTGSFITHLFFLYYLLLQDFDWKKMHVNPSFYAVALITVFTSCMVLISADFKDKYSVQLVSTQLSVVTVTKAETIKPPTVKPIPKIKPAAGFKTLTVTAVEGDNLSILSHRYVNDINSAYNLNLSDAELGNVQDYVMRENDYNNEINSGLSLTMDSKIELSQMIAISHVSQQEYNFWQQYYQSLL